MSSKEKIEQILSELELKAPTFASHIGVPYQRIFDIQREKTKKISGDLAMAISSKYPQYTFNWLLGKEDIPPSGDFRGNVSGTLFGGGNRIGGYHTTDASLAEENKRLAARVDKLTDDNAKLVERINYLTDKLIDNH